MQVLTGNSILNLCDVGKVSSVGDAQAPHPMCMAPFLWGREGILWGGGLSGWEEAGQPLPLPWMEPRCSPSSCLPVRPLLSHHLPSSLSPSLPPPPIKPKNQATYRKVSLESFGAPIGVVATDLTVVVDIQSV